MEPRIFRLWNVQDATAIGITLAERDRLLAKRIPYRNGDSCEAIFCHIQQGQTLGSLKWHANKVNASASTYLNKDGSIVFAIPFDHGAWTQGDVMSPTRKGLGFLEEYGWDPNTWGLSIEAEGYSGDVMPDVQFESLLWLIGFMQEYFPVLDNPFRIMEHADINTVSRLFCAGAYYDRLRAHLDAVPAPEYAPVRPIAGLYPWDGLDRKIGGTTFYAMRRVLVAHAPKLVRQYASDDAPEVRAPLAYGDRFSVDYKFRSDNGDWWFYTPYHSRIVASGLRPTVQIGETPLL